MKFHSFLGFVVVASIVSPVLMAQTKSTGNDPVSQARAASTSINHHPVRRGVELIVAAGGAYAIGQTFKEPGSDYLFKAEEGLQQKKDELANLSKEVVQVEEQLKSAQGLRTVEDTTTEFKRTNKILLRSLSKSASMHEAGQVAFSRDTVSQMRALEAKMQAELADPSAANLVTQEFKEGRIKELNEKLENLRKVKGPAIKDMENQIKASEGYLVDTRETALEDMLPLNRYVMRIGGALLFIPLGADIVLSWRDNEAHPHVAGPGEHVLEYLKAAQKKLKSNGSKDSNADESF